MKQAKEIKELSEDIEVVGPGQLLAEGRKSLGLSQLEVAEKLNFREALVKEIEQDVFDDTLPDTFNRGYLKNYAKLVNINVHDVLTSYETLNVAVKQGAEMQSFSKETEKQAQNNLLMWISYLILALLIGSSVIWWIQDAKKQTPIATKPSVQIANNANAAQGDKTSQQVVNDDDNQILPGIESLSQSDQISELDEGKTVALAETLIKSPSDQEINHDISTPITEESTIPVPKPAEQSVEDLIDASTAIEANQVGSESKAQFTFAGDCWVNIYDATGERVAWGIKKGGYVMNISGQAPFTVTLGKPELVSISFNDLAVDMSQFNSGNIAKFTLPLNSENQ